MQVSVGPWATGSLVCIDSRRAKRARGHSRGTVEAMNRNTSPQSRSTSRPRAQTRGRGHQSIGPASRIAHKAGAQAKARRARPPLSKFERARRMAFAVALPQAVLILAILAVALGALLLTGTSLAWLPAVIAESWMVLNLGPVVAGGITISVMPLLPALLFAFVIARRIRNTIRSKVSINDVAILAVAAVVVPAALTILAWLMLWDAGKVFDVSPPNLAMALPRILLLHLCVLAGGMGPRLWRALARRFGVSTLLVDAAFSALRYLAYAGIVSLVVFVIVAAVGWGRQSELLASYPHLGAGGVVGLVALSLLYLPNAVVYTMGVLSGAQLHVGDASVSLFNVDLVALPPVPLFGVVPASVQAWAVVLLLALPCSAAYLFYRRRPSFQFDAVAGLMAAVGMLILGYLSSGELGYYGFTGLSVWVAAGLSGVWLAAVGLAFAAASLLLQAQSARSAACEEEASVVPAPEDQVESDDAGEVAEEEDSPEDPEISAGSEDTDVDIDVDPDDGSRDYADVVDAEVVDAEVVDAEVVNEDSASKGTEEAAQESSISVDQDEDSAPESESAEDKEH